jgi:hypothetical protein
LGYCEISFCARVLADWGGALRVQTIFTGGARVKLLSIDSNPKLSKSQSGVWQGWRYAGLTLFPDNVLCPAAKAAGCMSECLSQQGRGNMATVTEARQAKADWFYRDPVAFLTQLKGELENHRDTCRRLGKRAAVRLNVLSDIEWETYGVPQAFPEIGFIDYTKLAVRLKRATANYHLIFSYSEREQYAKQCQIALTTDRPIAVVFRGGLPHQYLGRPVIDGDLSDIGNAFATGCVVGLRAKGTAYRDNTGFVVDNPEALTIAG